MCTCGLTAVITVSRDRRGLEQQIADHNAKKALRAMETRQEAAAIEQSLQVWPSAAVRELS